MSDQPKPPALPPPKEMEQLVGLRRSIIDTIDSIGVRRGSVKDDEDVVLVTRGEDARVRHAAIWAALNAVAEACDDRVSHDEFMQLAEEAWQYNQDSEDEEAGNGDAE